MDKDSGNNEDKAINRNRVLKIAFLLFFVIIAAGIVVILTKLKKVDEGYEEAKRYQKEDWKLEDVAAGNPEIIGRITVKDTHIDVPVAQADNNNKYIDTSAEGKTSFTGCPFLDYRNSPDLSDQYSVIYGHLVEDHLMFGDLQEFKDPDFWKEKRTGKLILTDGRSFDIEFAACITVNAEDEYGLYLDPIGASNNWNKEHLEEMFGGKGIQITEITEDDRILALSTCAEADSAERIMVFGKITEVLR